MKNIVNVKNYELIRSGYMQASQVSRYIDTLYYVVYQVGTSVRVMFECLSYDAAVRLMYKASKEFGTAYNFKVVEIKKDIQISVHPYMSNL